MSNMFLSASVPVEGRGDFYRTADPFLIQFAVRTFVAAALGRRTIVWGGHPAITPMVWAVAEDLGVDYAQAVILYQSKFFTEFFPDENKHFGNVVYVNAVVNDRAASLARMREEMIGSREFEAGIFIGGMEGIFEEYDYFSKAHPVAKKLVIPAPGGAARELAIRLGVNDPEELENVDFSRLVHENLGIAVDEPRSTTLRQT